MNITEEAKKILALIAEIQIDALQSIKASPSKREYATLIQQLGIQEEEIVPGINKLIEYYKSILDQPVNIYFITEYQALLCHHILFQMEEEWILDNSLGVFEAWSIFHSILMKYHPEFTYIK